MVSINRVVMQPASRRIIKALGPKDLEVAEVSGHWGREFDFKSYDIFRYPRWDICEGPYRDKVTGEMRTFDLVLANQVWEHLDRPYAATRHVYQMLRTGGHFWLAVPFFVPFHAAPQDNSRWSARGLKNLLIEGGFPEETIHSEQWGNRHVALRNMEKEWPPEYDEKTDSIKNDPMMPICAWALAQKV
ncbi:methyltransferase domain-containing protein [Sulfitobacter aestuariivivens]|uniref:Methyltransferase domain-containing protein n=1 Tax=Sulfitobacter aestuariivivens TaxID=2766981 RepID=A0A927HE43_9RHOB|nr:methyltransferase domain-containing protein [Sulfitobacter aestuariivivens]MBD3662964.1 methyltransferase domain-containing protein [Sulfitobacter aestuariivivens]